MLEKTDLESILNRVHTWTHQVDEKVNVLLAAQVGLFAFILEPLTEIFKNADWSYKAAVGTAFSLQIWAIWHAGRALFPQTHNVSRHHSVTFFGDIASQSLDDYRKRVQAMTPQSYDDDFLAQIHVCSQIVTLKFTHFKKSIIRAGIGLALLGITYVVFKVKG